MTRVGGRTVAAVVAFTLVGCSGRPEARPAAGGNPPTAPTTPDAGAIRPGRGAPTTPAAAAPVGQRPAGGLFGVPPAGAATAAPTTTAPPAAGRTDPAAVARAYAAGLYTVDWPRPLPGAQKLAATTPWATAAATAKLAHGQHYQPARTDSRVAAAQVDTVERVVVEDADAMPGDRAYLATIDIRTSSTHGVTTSRAFLLIILIPQAGKWLVDDSQVIG